MSTLTSSAINKSGKTVAPKAAPRRRPPGRAPPAQSSAPSVEKPTTDTTEPPDTRTAAEPEHQLATPPPTQASQPAEVTQPTETARAIQATPPNIGTQPVQEPQSAPNVSGTQSTTSHDPVVDSQSAEQTSERTSGSLPQRAQTSASQTQPDTHDESRTGSQEQQIERARLAENVNEPQGSTQEAETGITNSAQTLSGSAGSNDAPTEAVAQRSQTPRTQTTGQKRKRNQPVAQPSAQPSEEAPSTVDDASQDQQAVGGADPSTEEAQTTTGSASAAKPRRKRQKKQQELSNERITEEDDAQVVRAATETVVPLKKPRAKRKTKDVVASVEGAEAEGNAEGADGVVVPPKPKRQRKRKQISVPAVNDGEQAEAGEQEEEEEEEEIEDPESHEIDINTTTMASLTRDRALGKSSERGKKMAAIDWAEVVRKRREETHLPPPMNPENGQTGDGQEDAESTPNAEPQYRGLQLRMVNGEMVLDEESARIDRQAEALEDANHRAQIETEDDLTKKVTRMTWLEKKKRDPADRVPVYKMKSDPWSDDETDRFYEALSMFGTDFFIISKMFPPKTRRQIKLKFVREERLDGPRITRALSGDGSKPMDLSVYAEATGQEIGDFRDPEELAKELELEGQEQRVEIEKKKIELAEAQKQRDIQMEARDKEKEERDRQKQVSKDQRALARQRKKRGIVGTGTF